MLCYKKILLYSDTDSLITNRPINEEDVDQKVLGKFKLEGIATQKKVGIFSTKMLLFIQQLRKSKNHIDNIMKFKGISKQQRKDINILYNISWWRKSLHFKEIHLKIPLKNSFLRNFKDLSIKYDQMPREMNVSFNFDKRCKVFNRNKWVDTKPITIDRYVDTKPITIDSDPLVDRKPITSDKSVDTKPITINSDTNIIKSKWNK